MAIHGGSGAGSPGFSPAGRVRFEAIGEAFEELKRNLGTWAVSALIVWVVAAGILGGLAFVVGVWAMAAPNVSLGAVLVQILFPAVIVTMTAGQYAMALKATRGLPIQVGDMFSAFSQTPSLAVVAVLIGIIQGIGGVCFYLPGLIAAAVLMFAIPLVIDRNLGVTDAMTASFNAWKRDAVMATLFLIVISIVASLGLIACCIGVILTQPLMPIGVAIVYRDLFEGPAVGSAGPQFAPPAPPVAPPPTAPDPPAPSDPAV